MKPVLRSIFRFFSPESFVMVLKQKQLAHQRRRVASCPKLSESDFWDLLTTQMGLKEGDTVFVHSSVDRINLDFPFYKMLSILRSVVGESGNLLFPTYPKKSSTQFLKDGDIFNVKNTSSYSGILSEFFRRQKGVIRSFHPTKSVVAQGPDATELTNGHQLSPYPYDSESPYYKITSLNGKIIGIGVSTQNLSFVHCIDDALKEDFPVRPYNKTLYKAVCIDEKGAEQIVETYTHNPIKIMIDITQFIARYINSDVGRDFTFKGVDYFVADSQPLFEEMMSLAKKKQTIYNRLVYRRFS